MVMNRVSLMVVLLWSACALAQTSATVFKPNDKIQLTVKFDKKVDPKSTVDSEFRLKGGGAVETCKDARSMTWEGSSPDDQTFQMTTTVPDNIVSGTYQFAYLTLSSPGFEPTNSTQPVTLTLEIKNDKPCPKPVQVPKFDISIKP
jgi:hypothetical protein